MVEDKVEEYEESDDFDEETKKKHILIGLGFVVFCGVLLVTLVGSLFGGGSMDENDYFHLLNLHGTAVQSKIGSPNNIVTFSSGTRWIYDKFTLELGISSHVEQVSVTHKSIELAGCTISDSLKSVEKTMKKMDGKFLGSQADIFYSFAFQYKKKTYNLGCLVDSKGNIESLVLSSRKS